MAQKKKEKVELRYYDIPQREGVLALLGEEWRREYGDGIEYLHFHNLLEIGVCRAGSGTLVLDRKLCRFGPGMVSVIPQNFPHTTNSDPGTKAMWEYLFLDPDMILKEQFDELSLSRKRVHGLITRDALFLKESEAHTLYATANLIMDEMRSKQDFYIERVRGLLRCLLFDVARLNREAGEEPIVPEHTGVGQIQSALKYVEQHYTDPIRVEDLAQVCHISETHFRRLFSELVSMTPIEYVNMVRVLHSCEKLRSSNDSMAQVAMDCGFATVSTFDRNFKQVIGVTPYQWKRDPKNYESRLLEVDVSVRKGW